MYAKQKLAACLNKSVRGNKLSVKKSISIKQELPGAALRFT
jgi:hypothetical protein